MGKLQLFNDVQRCSTTFKVFHASFPCFTFLICEVQSPDRRQRLWPGHGQRRAEGRRGDRCGRRASRILRCLEWSEWCSFYFFVVPHFLNFFGVFLQMILFDSWFESAKKNLEFWQVLDETKPLRPMFSIFQLQNSWHLQADLDLSPPYFTGCKHPLLKEELRPGFLGQEWLSSAWLLQNWNTGDTISARVEQQGKQTKISIESCQNLRCPFLRIFEISALLQGLQRKSKPLAQLEATSLCISMGDEKPQHEVYTWVCLKRMYVSPNPLVIHHSLFALIDFQLHRCIFTLMHLSCPAFSRPQPGRHWSWGWHGVTIYVLVLVLVAHSGTEFWRQPARELNSG